MDIIYQLIKNLRFLFSSRKIKRFLTIILIIILLFIANMQAFATDGSFGGGEGGGGFRGDYEVVFNDNIINFINDAIYSFDNYKPLENNSFFFYDEKATCYRCVTWTGGDTGVASYSEQDDYDVKIYNWQSIFLYSIDFDTRNVTKVTKGNARGTTFNSLFDLPNAFSKYNFLYACYKSGYQNASVLDSYNNMYMKKTISVKPYVQYDGNSYVTDDYIIINPASTRVGENSFIPFDLELWNSNGGSIGDNVEYLKIGLSTLSSYWDNENKYYKIPYSTYLQLWTSNDGDYDLYVNLFTNDHFYMKKVILSFSVENGLIVNPTNPDNPDNPIDSDYTQNFNNIENAINSSTSAINNQTNKIEEQTNAINGTTQAINDTNDFLKDNTIDDSQFNLPTVQVNDPTANFFDTIFMGLYNSVTNNEEKTISFEILGNNISISSADFNYLNGNEWNVLCVILSSMWVFGIGIYILKDIRKMIDKIKDGNVENMATDDIKANMV